MLLHRPPLEKEWLTLKYQTDPLLDQPVAFLSVPSNCENHFVPLMFSYAKYVVGIPKSSLKRVTQAIVIPTTMQHTDVRGAFVDGSITSAGFFNYDEDRVYVSGNSTTLNRTCLPEDERLVALAIAHPSYAT